MLNLSLLSEAALLEFYKQEIKRVQGDEGFAKVKDIKLVDGWYVWPSGEKVTRRPIERACNKLLYCINAVGTLRKYVFNANYWGSGHARLEAYASNIDEAWQQAVSQAISISATPGMKNLELISSEPLDKTLSSE